MKHIKKYENNNTLEVRDYVICKPKSVAGGQKNRDFYNNNIGKFAKYLYGGRDVVDDFKYCIEYADVTHENMKYNHDFDWELGVRMPCSRVERTEIIAFSKNKEDLEAYIESKNYNL